MPEKTTGVLEADIGRRVLICEDDHDIAEFLRLMLEHNGVVADVAYDAANAKLMLAQHDYSAMTVDLGLPDQDGISLIRELRSAEATANLPIIVISGNADKRYMELQGETCAVIDWISTPTDHARLVTALKQALLPIIVVSANGGLSHNELNGDAFRVIDWINKPIDHDQLESALMLAITKASGKRPQMLLVEDDMNYCQMVNTITGEFADIENAPALAAARRMLKEKRYDLVILDVVMPDGSGMELLPDLQSATPPIPVMILSAHEITAEAIQQVGIALVKSRTDNAQLLATIKRMVGIE